MIKKTEAKKKLEEIEAQYEVENRASNINRARSITVGTCFGGTTEVLMRGDGGRHLWATMQPVEVIELIHQLAANVGCHIAIKPRNDFSSWRDWRIPEAERKHLEGHPPFVNDMAVSHKLGMTGFNQAEAEQIINEWLNQSANEYEYINGGANIKKPKNIKKQGKNNESMATEKSSDK